MKLQDRLTMTYGLFICKSCVPPCRVIVEEGSDAPDACIYKALNCGSDDVSEWHQVKILEMEQ